MLTVLIVLVTLLAKTNAQNCTCNDERLCAALNVPPRQEIIYWSTDANNWKNYDWDKKLTTVCVFGKWNPDLLCHAHSKNVRVTFGAFFPVAKLTDVQYRKKWISDHINYAKKIHADGLNFDTEEPIKNGSIQAKLLTEVTRETTEAFHREIPGSQVTFDIAWSPNCIDGRCYDFKGIAEASDFVMVMSYDERGQIFGPCVAGANSGFSTTFKGIQQYLDLGISREKIVLGLPWYGYDYTCLKLEGNICHIKHVPYRGVNCSDAAGHQHLYGNIMKQDLPKAIGGVQFDSATLSPYFKYKDESNIYHQVWFDNPKSLRLKYQHALKKLKLRGLAVWQVDCLDYSNNPVAKKQTKAMYDALLDEDDIF